MTTKANTTKAARLAAVIRYLRTELSDLDSELLVAVYGGRGDQVTENAAVMEDLLYMARGLERVSRGTQ